jgi:hypothetical protein
MSNRRVSLEVNISAFVWVELTPVGKALLRAHCNNESVDPSCFATQDFKYHRFQFHELMCIFGEGASGSRSQAVFRRNTVHLTAPNEKAGVAYKEG